MPLNAQQHAAAHAPHTTPLKIIAGAGTGKTETLAARYVELVRQGISPDRIVLLTFTEDAAAEMRARVATRLREAKIDLPPHALLDPWIATFHSFAMRLLREHGFAVGLPPTPRLLTEDEQQELWQTIREALEADRHVPPNYAPLDHATYRWDNDEAWNKALRIAAALRRGSGDPSELAPHAQLADQQLAEFAAHRDQLVPLITHCWTCYTAQLRARGVLDFDELLHAARHLFHVQPSIATRFDVLMIDEFQDTNRPQLDLLHVLQPHFGRTTVVGDPRQAIYGWNSARAESIYHFPFRSDPMDRGIEQPLTDNYRSHPAIIAMANAALGGSELSALATLVPAYEQRSRPAALEHEPVVALYALPTVEDEAQVIAAEIERLHGQGMAYDDMAILLRSRTQLPVLVAALGAAHIPYVLNGGTGFYLHWLVRLTSALLRLIGDPADHAAWAHILESPLIGLPPSVIAARSTTVGSDRTYLAYTTWLHDPASVPHDVPQRPAIVERLAAFQNLLEAARMRWGLLGAGAFVNWLWQASGIMHAAQASDDLQHGLILRHLQRDADEYGATHPADGIAGFAALLQRHIHEQPRVALPSAAVHNAVEIATVHQAKGREWPVVFVFHTALPSQRASQIESVLWDEQWQLVISDPGTSRTQRSDPLHTLRDDLRRRKRNEERSIWYVALTRAQHTLYVLHSGCPLVDDHFADAQAKHARGAAQESPNKADESIHFFHELWEHVQHNADMRSSGVVCYPTLP